MKTDTLTPIGGTLETYNRVTGVTNTRLVVAHEFAAGKVREMVVLLETREDTNR